MKIMITICVECKRELKMARYAPAEQAFSPLITNEAVVYSHGLCYECGVKLYGAELMAKVDARASNIR